MKDESGFTGGLFKVYGGLLTFRIGFGFLFLLFVVALIAAAGTSAPTGDLFADIVAWALSVALALIGLIKLAGALRARRFGDRSPSEPVLLTDLLGYSGAALGGPLLLFWFVPRLLQRTADWPIDALLCALGLLILSSPIRAFYKYVARP